MAALAVCPSGRSFDDADFAGHLALLPPENAASTVHRRKVALPRDQIVNPGTGRMALQPPRLVVKPLQCTKFFFAPQLGLLHGRFQHPDGLVIYAERHRKWVPVLAAVGE